MQWLKKLLNYESPDFDDTPRSSHSLFEKFDEKLSPNIRALRMTMSIADYLLAMGVSVSDVVSTSLDITDAYCKRPVQVDVSSTLLMFSQDRGDDREPLTLIRHSKQRIPNNLTVQLLQELAADIKEGKLTLDEAEDRLIEIKSSKAEYPIWMTTVGSAAISAGVGALLTGSLVIIAITFTIGALVTFLLRIMAERKIPAFFSQIFAATVITMTAGFVYWLSRRGDIGLLENVNPSLIIIGGIIMLVAGLAIVGAVQDAIDEFYVTANARLLRVFMMTIGIVVGVLAGLYIIRMLGQPLDINTQYPPLHIISWQYIGAFMIAAGYALSVQTKWTGVLLSGGMGLLSWYIYVTASLTFDMAVFAASGAAAIAVGVAASLIARGWRVPTNALITAGIIPLVPGLTLFNGLLQLVQDSTYNGSLTGGLITLFNATAIAIAIAAGATLGNMIARPVDRTLVKARNALPERVTKI